MRGWLVLAWIGCATKEETGAPEGVFITGTVTSDDGSSAEVAVVRAFGFTLDGVGVIYLASGPDATCEEVATYLNFDTTEYDPTALWPPQTCNLFLRFSYDVAAGFDGLVLSGSDVLNPWVVSCAMDEGVWEYGESNEFVDYFYSGRYFQGTVRDGSTTLTGAEGDLSVTVAFSAYEGGFTYEEMETVFASGAVSGSGPVEWCTDLGTTGYF